MKSSLFFVLSIIISVSLLAQNATKPNNFFTKGFYWGFEGGYYSTRILNNSDFLRDSMGNFPRHGIRIGLVAEKALTKKNRTFIKTGLCYSTKGNNFDKSVYDPTLKAITNTGYHHINYLDGMLTIEHKIKLSRRLKFVFGGGLVGSMLVNGKDHLQQVDGNRVVIKDSTSKIHIGNDKEQYKRLDMGITFFAGFEHGKLQLLSSFSRGYGDIFHDKENVARINNMLIGASAIVLINKPKAKIVIKSNTDLDSDKDSILDINDDCPNIPGKRLTNGCPDDDNDGIANADDKCPTIPGKREFQGCPDAPNIDTDGDGILDYYDKCPYVKGLEKYQGCMPLDTDKDGIIDDEDSCVYVPGVPKYHGCPVPDSDNDGINDDNDKCPQTPAPGTVDGCPVIEKKLVDTVNIIAKRIQFNLNSFVLVKKSRDDLDYVTKVLNNYPQMKLKISGYTSSEGFYDKNVILSVNRANAVKNYLINNGIDPSRLSADGYGPNKLLNAERNETERALNRRVELDMYYD